MTTSGVNTERGVKTHRKCVGTENMVFELEEEPEVVILKEINNIRCTTDQTTPERKQVEKRTWCQAKPNRQERLYADILADQAKKVIRTTEKENKNEGRDRQRMDARKKRKAVIREESQKWMEKFREWAPQQEWPITEKWQRSSRPTIPASQPTSGVANTQALSKSADAASPTRDRGTAVGGWTREYKSGMLSQEMAFRRLVDEPQAA